METTKPSPPWEGSSQFKMADVGEKSATLRKAIAQGKIHLSESSFATLTTGRNPKGNVLAIAEIAGIQAAKKTSDLIPLCHPLPIDKVRVHFQLLPEETSVLVFCEVSTHAKTGVEMEALSGVNGALLSIYDLSKAVDPVLSLSDIRLNVKEGGKQGRWVHPDFKETFPRKKTSNCTGVRIGVITVSDRSFRGERPDKSGPELVTLIAECAGTLTKHALVSDDKQEIQRTVRELIRDQNSDVVFLTGGTGLSPRDITPEALENLWTRKIPGIPELLRSRGALSTSHAWLSRCEAGIIENALVVALPGSLGAVRDGWKELNPILSHAVHVLRGGDH